MFVSYVYKLESVLRRYSAEMFVLFRKKYSTIDTDMQFPIDVFVGANFCRVSKISNVLDVSTLIYITVIYLLAIT